MTKNNIQRFFLNRRPFRLIFCVWTFSLASVVISGPLSELEPINRPWFPTMSGEYAAGIDRQEFFGGEASAYLFSETATEKQSASIQQTFLPCLDMEELRVSAYLKTIDAQAAGLLITINTSNLSMKYRPGINFLSDTSGWLLLEEVVSLPKDCMWMNIGFYLNGSGEVWADEFVIEEAGLADQPTAEFRKKYYDPSSLKFGSFESPEPELVFEE